MMGVFMLFLPSGLCLYMLTNSLLGIGQQQLNLYRTTRDDAAALAAKAAAPVVVSDAPSAASGETKKTDGGAGGRRDKTRRPSRG